MVDRSFIDQLADVWGNVASLGRGLGPEEWKLPTECPGWSVKDQLSHLIGTESSLLGRPRPEPPDRSFEHVRNRLGEANESWVDERRARSGREVLEEFEGVTARRLAALREMSDEDLEEPTQSPIGEVPYATFMQIRVMDCWVHEQDIRHALDLPARLDCGAARVALDRFASSLGFIVGKRVAPPDGTSVVFEVTGVPRRNVALSMEGGRAVPAETTLEASVTIRIDAEAFASLAAGRWSAGRVLDEGRATLEGDPALGQAVLEALPHIP